MGASRHLEIGNYSRSDYRAYCVAISPIVLTSIPSLSG